MDCLQCLQRVTIAIIVVVTITVNTLWLLVVLFLVSQTHARWDQVLARCVQSQQMIFTLQRK